MDFLNTEDDSKFVKWQRVFNYSLCVSNLYFQDFVFDFKYM